MADIELLIKISEEDLKNVGDTIFTISEMYETTQGRVYRAIVNGVPLPKGHGRIIDESKITQTTYETIEEEFESLLHGTIKRRYVVFKGSDAPTIIEADRSEEKE